MKDTSPAKAQRRKEGRKELNDFYLESFFASFLCAFAPLREIRQLF
jgi:hypothetical protein